ncbi:tyrosine-protein kinase receptor [Trichonephila clavipes]|nr:tyrosine-protein kinase receptor [Trichonephila clavipes]
MWSMVAQRLTQITLPAAPPDQLWQCAEAAWCTVPQEHIQSLFESMPKRVAAIRACQDNRPNMRTDPCSTKAITSVRTLHLAGADDIRSSSVQIQTENVTSYSGFVKWEEPKESNGIIIAYTLEYKRLNGENVSMPLVCLAE